MLEQEGAGERQVSEVHNVFTHITILLDSGMDGLPARCFLSLLDVLQVRQRDADALQLAPDVLVRVGVKLPCRINAKCNDAVAVA